MPRQAHPMTPEALKIILLPCPFCGGAAHYDAVTTRQQITGYVVTCAQCGGSSGVWPAHCGAAKAWNTRANPAG